MLLKNTNHEDYPGWDFGLAGDKEFPGWMAGLQAVHAGDEQEYFRPLKIQEWRDRLPPDRPNPDRFPMMFDIIERDPTWWIYYSW